MGAETCANCGHFQGWHMHGLDAKNVGFPGDTCMAHFHGSFTAEACQCPGYKAKEKCRACLGQGKIIMSPHPRCWKCGGSGLEPYQAENSSFLKP